jgi:hypothetical protein
MLGRFAEAGWTPLSPPGAAGKALPVFSKMLRYK